LSWALNVSRDGAFFTWLGRLFHAVGPETEKEQSPNLVEDRGTCKRFFEDDRSRSYMFVLHRSAARQCSVKE